MAKLPKRCYWCEWPIKRKRLFFWTHDTGIDKCDPADHETQSARR